MCLVAFETYVVLYVVIICGSYTVDVYGLCDT